MKRHFFYAAVTSLSFAIGCAPMGKGGTGAGATSGPSAIGAGGSSASGAGGASQEGSGGGATGALPDPISDPTTPCDVCSSALGGAVSGALCGTSQTALDSLVACACTAACATVCGGGSAPGSCLEAWQGNLPLECKTCLVSSTGCGAAWSACLADDGVTPASGASSSSSGGLTCSCDAALPLCPGGGSCATPGPASGAGNQACGSAEYCAPCCDPGDTCAAQGACKVTKIDQTPCAMDYECCSGVCTAGKCDGGCGILFNF
jgi:hypothetical protein